MEADGAFRNPQIDPAGLPSFRAVEMHPVDRKYFPYACVNNGLIWPIVALLAVLEPFLPFVNLPFNGGWLALLMLVPLPLAILWSWLDARHRGWAVREHDLISRKGVIFRTTTIMPVARVQHVETASGPMERRFGLMRIKCFTAGSVSADLVLAGLSADQARRIRNWLMVRIRARGDAPEVSDEADPGDDD